MNHFQVGCILFFTHACFAQRTPTITSISEDQAVDIGGTVELSCSVQYRGEFSVHWLKEGKTPREIVFISTGTSLVVRDSRFTILQDSASTYTILIKDLHEDDAGIYVCEVVLSVINKISLKSRLSVRRPPIISDNSSHAIVTSVGESIDLECYASGFPKPKVLWRRANNELLPSGESHVPNKEILSLMGTLVKHLIKKNGIMNMMNI